MAEREARAEHAAAAAAGADAQALVPPEHLAEAEAEGVVAGDPLAEHAAAAAAAEPDFTFRVAPLPRVTVLTAGRGAHPDPESGDDHPCVVSASHSFLLVQFDGPIFFGSVAWSHLVVVRDFLTADGESTASAERVPLRTRPFPVVCNLEGLVIVPSGDGGCDGYTIAELQVQRRCDVATVIYLRSGPGEAEGRRARRVAYPLAAADRRWRPHGAVHVDDTIWWFDLTWGILSCAASLEDAARLAFHELPDGRGLGERDELPPRIHTKRCVSASQGRLRYVEIIGEGGGAARVCMWSRSRNPCGVGWRWDADYSVSFEKIWSDDSYRKTGLTRNAPLLVVVCPSDPHLVYFALEQRIFGVNVLERMVVHNHRYEIPGPPRPASGRYVVAWEPPLLPQAAAQDMPDASTLYQPVRLIAPPTLWMPEAISSGSSIPMHDVWAQTADAEFEEINALLRRGAGGEYMVGLDSEFAVPNGVVPLEMEPPTADCHYTELCKKVNGGDLVQIGIVVAYASFKVQGMWQFNIRFDASSRVPWHDGVAFLRDQCRLNLQEHKSHGIPISRFMHWLVSSGLLRNQKVTWITYAGGADFGFLIRLLTGKDTLPELRWDFLMLFWEFFPRSYDVRVFTKLGRCRKKAIHGGLAQVCQSLQVERTGEAHQAGSDALSAVRCFEKMVMCDSNFATESKKYRSFLYGLVVEIVFR
ncbi:unnamed protein product [Urochloa decumbens]|uniref:DUF1618 domain-containing protein n=1 Tax=Urochloa decumbens TaxID=240449 RepID=A0ABC8WGY0_9POAL